MKDIKLLLTFRFLMFGLAGFMSLLFAVAGYFYYQKGKEEIRQAKYNELKAIAELKVNQIVAWREERLADAQKHTEGAIGFYALSWLRNPENRQLRDRLKRELKNIQKHRAYKSALITDTKGHVIFSPDPVITGLDEATKQHIAQAVSQKETILSDFYICKMSDQPCLDVSAPILDEDRRPVAALVFITNPGQDIYPLIQYWPTPNQSAETMLIRREGDNVLFLNQLRHRPDPPLTLHIPLARAYLPAVQAALGKTGLFEGLDYRGIPVLADLRPVPNSTWFMVVKMDRDEILAELSYRSSVVLLLVFLAILTTLALAAFLFTYRQRSLYHDLLRLERERWKAQEETRVALYSIGDGVMVTDMTGLVVRMNPVAEQLTGWTEAEAMGKPLEEIFRIVNEDTRISAEDPFKRVLREGVVSGLANHTLLIARNGAECPIADSGAPIRNEMGEISGVVMVFRDQTEERAAHKALLKEKVTAKRYLDIAGVMIVALDASARIILINKRGCEILGYKEEEISGRNWFDHFLPARIREEFQGIFSRRMAGEKNLTDYVEIPVVCRTGEERLIAWHITLIRDETGAITGTLSSGEDITGRKQAEKEMAELQGQLRQAQKMEAMGRLASGIAHDFNNILTVITGHCDLSLLSLRPGDPLRANIEEIRQSAGRAADLTRQLLVFSRKQHLEMRVVDLNQILRQLDKMLQRVIGEDIRLVLMVSEPLDQVKADTGQIEQVIVNLVVNARDAMPEGGQLTIETANVEFDENIAHKHFTVRPGAYVMLAASDTGIGMTPEIKERIFEPFFTTKEPGKGTGLGLATVYGIVKQSDGHIWVYSEPGQGTTVKIYLPRVEESPEEITQMTVTKDIPRGQENILVVEDDETVRKLAVTILQRQGYHVFEAASGGEALLLCEGFEYPLHLILTDVVMPGMSGRELVERLQEAHPRMKALYMSGYTNNAIVHHGILDAGINFIQKPFTVDGLARKVRAALST